MSRSIRDLIDEKIRDYSWDNVDEPVILKLDTYSYAMLLEELGISPENVFSKYKGLKIKVDPDLVDLCEIE